MKISVFSVNDNFHKVLQNWLETRKNPETWGVFRDNFLVLMYRTGVQQDRAACADTNEIKTLPFHPLFFAMQIK